MNALLVLMTAIPTLTVPTSKAHLIALVKPDILEMGYLVPVGNVKIRASIVENIHKKSHYSIKKRCNPDFLICQKQRAIHFRNKWRLVHYFFLQYVKTYVC